MEAYAEYGAIGVIVLLFVGQIMFLQRTLMAKLKETDDKVVITGGDRSDIQLAALQTSTKCLILTGNLHPSPVIVDRARQIGVPIILVMDDTLTAVEKMEDVLGNMRVREGTKIARARELFEQNVDFDRLYSMLDAEN